MKAKKIIILFSFVACLLALFHFTAFTKEPTPGEKKNNPQDISSSLRK